MHATLSSRPSFFRGWIIAMGSLPKHRTIFWLNCPVWCVLLPDSSSSYLRAKSHVSDAIRRQLHWLDISERVRFKLCVANSRVGAFTGRLLHTCLKFDCIPVSLIAGRSHLRSAASGDLFIPATNTVTIGPRAFAVACPAAWNSPPPELHDKSMSLMTFRKKLKTYLFKIN